VDAAQEQIAAIRALKLSSRLDGLSDKLREAARLRMEHPELTLSQLAELCDPPVTKSCLNHGCASWWSWENHKKQAAEESAAARRRRDPCHLRICMSIPNIPCWTAPAA
jgi:hypothetical protein